MYGAQIYLSCPAEALHQRADGSWDVQTPQGNINAKKIINAAGIYESVFVRNLIAGMKSWLLFKAYCVL